MRREIPVVETDLLANQSDPLRDRPPVARWRVVGLGAGLAALVLCLLPGFSQWIRLALAEDLHSHVILIPLVCGYLLAIGRERLAWDSKPAPRSAAGVILLTVALALGAAVAGPVWSAADAIAIDLATFVGCAWGLGLGFLGRGWMRSAAFPMGFMIFMIPLPDAAVDFLEQFLIAGSAWLSELVFRLGGVPVFRSGQVLEIPGITLRVAKACSGIRSTWVLFITSLLVGHLFLPPGLGRPALVALVVPLGILRNSLRIFVIGWLCVTYGPDMINSWIHRHGGPLFFAASLIPLFAMAWWLRRSEAEKFPEKHNAPPENRQKNAPPPGVAG